MQPGPLQPRYREYPVLAIELPRFRDAAVPTPKRSENRTMNDSGTNERCKMHRTGIVTQKQIQCRKAGDEFHDSVIPKDDVRNSGCVKCRAQRRDGVVIIGISRYHNVQCLIFVQSNNNRCIASGGLHIRKLSRSGMYPHTQRHASCIVFIAPDSTFNIIAMR